MGKPIARTKDTTSLPAGHVMPFSWPNSCTGMFQVGSLDTFCNNEAVINTNPLLRSVSMACPPTTPLANTMAAQTGSMEVFTNSFPTARMFDQTEHCGIPQPPGIIQSTCSLDTYA